MIISLRSPTRRTRATSASSGWFNDDFMGFNGDWDVTLTEWILKWSMDVASRKFREAPQEFMSLIVIFLEINMDIYVPLRIYAATCRKMNMSGKRLVDPSKINDSNK